MTETAREGVIRRRALRPARSRVVREA
jgi:hypothetical protein